MIGNVAADVIAFCLGLAVLCCVRRPARAGR